MAKYTAQWRKRKIVNKFAACLSFRYHISLKHYDAKGFRIEIVYCNWTLNKTLYYYHPNYLLDNFYAAHTEDLLFKREALRKALRNQYKYAYSSYSSECEDCIACRFLVSLLSSLSRQTVLVQSGHVVPPPRLISLWKLLCFCCPAWDSSCYEAKMKCLAVIPIVLFIGLASVTGKQQQSAPFITNTIPYVYVQWQITRVNIPEVGGSMKVLTMSFGNWNPLN